MEAGFYRQRFHRQPEPRQPTPECPSPGSSILPMTDSEILNTFKSAEKHGGSFITHLARAGTSADPINRAKLLKTWPELYQTYGPGTALYKEEATL